MEETENQLREAREQILYLERRLETEDTEDTEDTEGDGSAVCSPGSLSCGWSETVRLVTEAKPQEGVSWRKRYEEIETVL